MLRKCLLIVCCAVAISGFANQQSSKQSDSVKQQVKKTLVAISTDKTSLLQKKLHKEARALHNPLGILFYQPTYIMPFYYTGNPDEDVYTGQTPDNQQVKNEEFKFQFSFQLPVWRDMFTVLHRPVSLYASYTQLSYWQFYAKSQYFRETNYEPEIFLTSNFFKNWLARLGFNHQSNGRGGATERSWNRIFLTVNVSRGHWLFSVEPWLLVFKADSSDIHNRDIADYLGHEQFVVAYKFDNRVELSLMVRNVERFGSRMTEQAAISIPVTKHMNLYFQVFHGFGQSLLEYQQKTTSAGVGISLSNWL